MKFWDFYLVSVLSIQITMVVLKVANVVAWPWHETLMPTIAMAVLVLLVLMFRLAARILTSIAESWMDSDNEKYARWLAKKSTLRRAKLETTSSEP